MVTRCAALGLLLLGAVGSLPQKQDPCEAGFHYNESYGSCCYLCLSDLVPQKPCPQRLEDCRKKCDPDHYLEIEEESRCQACVNCSRGTLEEDTVCEPCLPGTFSNHSSTAKDCQPHTRISDLPDPSNTTANPSDRSSTHDIGTLSPSLTGRPNPGSESLFWVATVFAVTLAFVLLLICQQRACRKGILQKLHLPSGQAFQPKVMSMGYSLKKNCQRISIS
ncbi:tumor necrosis factor receptor superfamily member 8 isoform X2 [Vombatus ursinus]|uniref:tumor necrosis factor receptor superfamily member 8 isoform X2 n=1 Tax=Vombatus ursinus TaxID=29139 RepID=UPI000FFD4DE1|nr:tumor necrosis factor receptor superfamily member 8 isoform X2 [Vombatus ursinus]